MSSPVHTVRSDALLFEAALEMQNKACNVLAIKGNTNDIVGLVTTDSILQVHKYSTGVIIQQIEAAESIDEIRSIRLKIPKLIRAYISSGANASNVTRIISAIADSIAERVIELVVNEIGKPPVQFAFMVMGSEGREEQTLKTDQDNAIVYEDVEVSMQTETEEYFHLLAEKVNKSLDTIGYALCKGGIMASNPEWCKPLSVWKDYFHSWSKSGDGKDLMDVNIFFDFRFVYGEGGLVDELKTYVIGELKKSDVFYYHMAESVLAFKPPLNIFGNIVLDANESGTTFDIKKVLMAISGFARLYSLKNSIQETNTLRRIHKLFDKGILQGSVYQEMIDAYDYLMLIRFKNQVAQMEEGNSPDNLIPLSGLSHIEQTLIKNILTQISGFLSKLSVDFKSVL
ncbi:MAG: hypothetical protein C0594_17330 [Marinilabiliales bacterium]|nr:MAG: hypothetical protein C0594_17330 [Marinilabiliales bacterium]